MKQWCGLIDIKIKWALGHELINKFDNWFLKDKDVKKLENNNEEICKIFKKETIDVLGKILQTALLKMKNSFSNSDA